VLLADLQEWQQVLAALPWLVAWACQLLQLLWLRFLTIVSSQMWQLPSKLLEAIHSNRLQLAGQLSYTSNNL